MDNTKINQKELKNIKNNLHTTFSKYSNQYDVTTYVESKMRKFLFSSLYTNRRCEDIFNEALKEIEEDVNKKYNIIARQINDYIEEKEKIFYDGTNTHEYSDNDLGHLAVGAGAGLTAAIIFSGPVGWLIGIGAGIAALYNSVQKKNTLIKNIMNVSTKLNDKAISMLEKALDEIIIPDPILIDEIPIDDLFSSDNDESSLTQEQKDTKHFLEKRGIQYLIHFSDSRNYESIKKNGIISINEGKRRGVYIKVFDNNISAKQVEKKHSIQREDYISLSISTINEDLLWSYKWNNGLKEVVVFKIDASILWKEKNDIIFCDRNASTSTVKSGRTIKDFENMFVEEIKYTSTQGKSYDNNRKRDGIPDNITTNPGAEIWFRDSIDYDKYIKYCYKY